MNIEGLILLCTTDENAVTWYFLISNDANEEMWLYNVYTNILMDNTNNSDTSENVWGRTLNLVWDFCEGMIFF